MLDTLSHPQLYLTYHLQHLLQQSILRSYYNLLASSHRPTIRDRSNFYMRVIANSILPKIGSFIGNIVISSLQRKSIYCHELGGSGTERLYWFLDHEEASSL